MITMADTSSFYCEVDESFPRSIIDEKGNSYLEFSKFRWNGKGDFKLGIRKLYSNSQGEHNGKSMSFLTEDGPHELCNALIKTGFGHADEIVETCLQDRKDIVGAFANTIDKLNKIEIEECVKAWNDAKENDEENMFDPEDIL